MRLSRVLLASLLLVLQTGSLFAQAPAPAAPQAVPPAPAGQGWIAVVMAVVLIIAVGVASFMSAKRTHQD